MFLLRLSMCLALLVVSGNSHGAGIDVPVATKSVVASLQQAGWNKLEDGLDVVRAVTQSGLVITAYRISPSRFKFEVVLQSESSGSRAKAIGEHYGAALVFNGGFFAQKESGTLVPVGYLRLGEEVHSYGWENAGGLIVFEDDGPRLLPTHQGIPKKGADVLQSRPMLLEPGGKWAMGSNLGKSKPRTLFCRMADGAVVVVVISRVGMSLYEAGWVLRKPEDGGFFNCDSAVALDGGRSTQMWYSGNSTYDHSGLTPVQNFVIVRQRDD